MRMPRSLHRRSAPSGGRRRTPRSSWPKRSMSPMRRSRRRSRRAASQTDGRGGGFSSGGVRGRDRERARRRPLRHHSRCAAGCAAGRGARTATSPEAATAAATATRLPCASSAQASRCRRTRRRRPPRRRLRGRLRGRLGAASQDGRPCRRRRWPFCKAGGGLGRAAAHIAQRRGAALAASGAAPGVPPPPSVPPPRPPASKPPGIERSSPRWSRAQVAAARATSLRAARQVGAAQKAQLADQAAKAFAPSRTDGWLTAKPPPRWPSTRRASGRHPRGRCRRATRPPTRAT